jgi:hypothetical protein
MDTSETKSNAHDIDSESKSDSDSDSDTIYNSSHLDHQDVDCKNNIFDQKELCCFSTYGFCDGKIPECCKLKYDFLNFELDDLSDGYCSDESEDHERYSDYSSDYSKKTSVVRNIIHHLKYFITKLMKYAKKEDATYSGINLYNAAKKFFCSFKNFRFDTIKNDDGSEKVIVQNFNSICGLFYDLSYEANRIKHDWYTEVAYVDKYFAMTCIYYYYVKIKFLKLIKKISELCPYVAEWTSLLTYDKFHESVESLSITINHVCNDLKKGIFSTHSFSTHSFSRYSSSKDKYDAGIMSIISSLVEPIKELIDMFSDVSCIFRHNDVLTYFIKFDSSFSKLSILLSQIESDFDNLYTSVEKGTIANDFTVKIRDLKTIIDDFPKQLSKNADMETFHLKMHNALCMLVRHCEKYNLRYIYR